MISDRDSEGEDHQRSSPDFTVALQTVGCKLNQAETDFLADQFLQAGYTIVDPDSPATVYILNTCTVTHVADRKCRHLLRSYHHRYPQALLVAIGCYAERAPEELARIEGVKLVVGQRDKAKLVELVNSRLLRSEAHPAKEGRPLAFPGRTRALVKVQEGCNHRCTYCIVPRVRGPARDVPEDEIVDQVKARVEEGFQEVILTGTQIGAYGGGLAKLLERLLNETGVKRLRLSSLEPQDLSPDLLRLWESGRICRHLHLPLQSGCDSVLRRMGRRYTTEEYWQKVNLAREFIPDLAITTDIMVGFPGETEEEFRQSYEFCRQIGFARIHVFPFSERPGTPAARLPNKVPEPVKRQRRDEMLKLAKLSAQEFRRRFLGRKLEVLWEGQKNGLWFGYTDNYLRVFTQSDHDLRNLLLPTRLTRELDHGLAEGLVGEVEFVHPVNSKFKFCGVLNPVEGVWGDDGSH